MYDIIHQVINCECNNEPISAFACIYCQILYLLYLVENTYADADADAFFLT